MNFLRTSFRQVTLVGGTVFLLSVFLVITGILYFLTRDAITKMLSVILPAGFDKITTNIIFGLLALSFLLAIIARWTG